MADEEESVAEISTLATLRLCPRLRLAFDPSPLNQFMRHYFASNPIADLVREILADSVALADAGQLEAMFFFVRLPSAFPHTV